MTMIFQMTESMPTNWVKTNVIARWGEEIISLDNPLTWISDVIKINLKYMKNYKELLKNRKEWRERIEELRR